MEDKHAGTVAATRDTRPIFNERVLVQYGCGLSCPVGWLNFDASPRLWAERTPLLSLVIRVFGRPLFPEQTRFGNIVSGLPIEQNTADAIFACHVLEHLPRTAVPMALKNTFRALKPGGVFRLVVPDLAWRISEYQRRAVENNPRAADIFLADCMLGMNDQANGIADRIRLLYGNSRHLWMYDYPLLEALLLSSGFTKIRRCEMGDSPELAFKNIEAKDRFFEGNFPELAIEAIKQ